MEEQMVDEKKLDRVNQFIDLYNQGDFAAALQAADGILADYPDNGTAAVYRIVCLDKINRTRDAMQWRQHILDNPTDFSLSDSEQVTLAEQEAELELSLMYSSFSGFNQELETRFPVSREEYEEGKRHFLQSWEYHVGSDFFERRYETARKVIEKAESRHFTGNKLIWLLGGALALVSILTFFRTRDPAWLYGTVYYTIGFFLYRIGSMTPGYLLAKRMKESMMIRAIGGSMFNTFSKTENKRYKVFYTDGTSEIQTGSQQLQVGLTFMIISLGFFLFRVVAITWIGLANLIRNRM